MKNNNLSHNFLFVVLGVLLAGEEIRGGINHYQSMKSAAILTAIGIVSLIISFWTGAKNEEYETKRNNSIRTSIQDGYFAAHQDIFHKLTRILNCLTGVSVILAVILFTIGICYQNS
jgi:amino acid permease